MVKTGENSGQNQVVQLHYRGMLLKLSPVSTTTLCCHSAPELLHAFTSRAYPRPIPSEAPVTTAVKEKRKQSLQRTSQHSALGSLLFCACVQQRDAQLTGPVPVLRNINFVNSQLR